MNANDPNYGKWSDDGNYWWDGEAWQPQPRIETVEESSPDRRLAYSIIGLVTVLMVLFAGLGAVVLAGGGDSNESLASTSDPRPWYDKTPKPTYTPPPVPDTPTLADAAWLALLAEWPEAASVGRSEMEDFAEVTCSAFGVGTTFEEAAMLAFENGFSSSEAGTILGYAIFGFCPEYEYLLGE